MGSKLHFEFECNEGVERGQRDLRGRAEGFLVLSGNKAQGEEETAKTGFRGEALGGPRPHIKLATWFLAALS